MPASKAQQRATNKWISKAYDRINLTVPKGKKDAIQAQAEAQGQSVNGYINAAIDARMSQEAPGAAESGETIISVSLIGGTAKSAQEAANAAGEAIPAFISRAVETQAQRDALARKMNGGQ